MTISAMTISAMTRRHFLALGPVALTLWAGWPFRAKASPFASIGPMELLRSIGSSRGRVVLVNFFASWCPPCRKVIPNLITLRQEYPVDRLVIIGVSIDHDPEMLERYARETSFNYPVYEAREEIASVFDLSSIPKVLIYNKGGTLALSDEVVYPIEEFRRILDQLIGA